jgi:hypothetical protein
MNPCESSTKSKSLESHKSSLKKHSTKISFKGILAFGSLRLKKVTDGNSEGNS